jgi:hypothetical protein
MSTGFEQRLRSEMEQVAVRPRPGLVKEAYRSYRGKRRTTRAVAATGAAAIATGTAVGVAAAASPTATPAQTTAYVVRHVGSALAAANRMAYTNTTFRVPKNAVLTHPEPVIDGWSYGIRNRTLRESAGGQPLTEYWVRTGHGKPAFIVVNYQNRRWERLAYKPVTTGPQAGLCRAPQFFLILGARSAAAADWKPIVESGLRCGLFHVAGHQRVEGIDAIKLTGTADTGITLWVDPHTYLPVQVAGNVQIVESTGKNGPVTAKATIWIHFRWLSPTRANLAQLTGTIPSGFRQVGR